MRVFREEAWGKCDLEIELATRSLSEGGLGMENRKTVDRQMKHM